MTKLNWENELCRKLSRKRQVFASLFSPCNFDEKNLWKRKLNLGEIIQIPGVSYVLQESGLNEEVFSHQLIYYFFLYSK